jgi:hypothetical protein
MEDQLISFETAILAKEKGFDILDEDTNPIYVNGILLYRGHGCTDELLFVAIKQSLLQKWLREVHNIHIWIRFRQDEPVNKYEYNILIDINDKRNEKAEICESYENALEIALYESLLLI